MKLLKKISAAVLSVSLIAGGLAASGKDFLKAVYAKDVESTLTFNKKCEGSGVASDGTTWTVESDAAESTFDSTKGIHYGTGSVAISYLKLTSSEFTNTVSKVVVNCSDSNKTAILTVKVGSTDFTYGDSQDTFVVESAYNNSAYTFVGEASGAVVVSLDRDSAKKGMYVKSIVVTYDDGASEINVTGVSLSKTSATIISGNRLQLEATVLPDEASDKSVTWSSDDNAIATVDENGVVKGIAPGTTDITVVTTDGEFDATCSITVVKDTLIRDTLTVESFTADGTSYVAFSDVSANSSALYAGLTNNNKTYFGLKNKDGNSGVVTTNTGGLLKSIEVELTSGNLKPVALYAKNKPYTSANDLYSSDAGVLIESNITATKYIEINEDYQYFGIKSEDGTAQVVSISARWEPVKPTEISLVAKSSTSIAVATTETIEPTFINSELVVTETGLTWESSNTDVATVSDGVVTGVSVGKATITAISTADTNVKATIDVDIIAEAVHVESVSLSSETLEIIENFQGTLTATVLPDNAYDKSVSWSSGDATIATVEDGVVTAVAPGETTITVTTKDGEKTATCTVTVKKDPYIRDVLTVDSFTATTNSYKEFSDVSANSAAKYAGLSNNNTTYFGLKNKDNSGLVTTATGGLIRTLKIELTEENTKKISVYAKNEPYLSVEDIFTSGKYGDLIESNITSTKFIEISEDYQYFAIKATDGTAQVVSITARWEPVKPTSITLEAESSSSIVVGNTETIVPAFENEEFVVTDKTLTWSSSNESIATVENGVVTAVAVGEATITAKLASDENISGTIDVTVIAEAVHVESVSLSSESLDMVDGETKTLTETVLPEDASDKSVIWSSGDTTIATVENGVVKAVGGGTTTITVTTTDGKKTATCEVTVTMRPRASYKLVTDASELVLGAKYIVVGVKDTTYYAMGHYTSGNNIKSFEISSPENNIFTDVEETLESYSYVLGGEAGAYTFFDGENWIWAAGGSSNNYLKASTTITDNSRFTIEINPDSFEASICSISTTVTNKLLRYNSGNNLFSCYLDNTKQSSVYLYRVLPKGGTADEYALNFLSETGSICAGDGNHKTQLEAIWDGLSDSYNELSSKEQGALISEQPSAMVKAALERYDYLVRTYSLDAFINGHEVPAGAGYITLRTNSNNNNAVFIIVVISLVSVTTLGILITLKKRKPIVK